MYVRTHVRKTNERKDRVDLFFLSTFCSFPGTAVCKRGREHIELYAYTVSMCVPATLFKFPCVCRNRVERYFSFFPRDRYFPVLQRRTCQLPLAAPPSPRPGPPHTPEKPFCLLMGQRESLFTGSAAETTWHLRRALSTND